MNKDLEVNIEQEEVVSNENIDGIEEVEELELTSEQLQTLLGGEEYIDMAAMLESEMVVNRTLYLNQEITLDTINYIIQLIHKFNRDDYDIPVEERIPIVIYIDSVGGEIYRGLSLCSTIESSDTPIIGVLQGSCMSMALIIWQACHVRYASRFSNVLYHTLRAGSDVETLPEMKNKIRHYEYLQKMLDDYILEKTEIPKKKLKKKRESNLDWFLTFSDLTKYKMYDYVIDLPNK